LATGWQICPRGGSRYHHPCLGLSDCVHAVKRISCDILWPDNSPKASGTFQIYLSEIVPELICPIDSQASKTGGTSKPRQMPSTVDPSRRRPPLLLRNLPCESSGQPLGWSTKAVWSVPALNMVVLHRWMHQTLLVTPKSFHDRRLLHRAKRTLLNRLAACHPTSRFGCCDEHAFCRAAPPCQAQAVASERSSHLATAKASDHSKKDILLKTEASAATHFFNITNVSRAKQMRSARSR